jgi:tight adherence protein B
VNRRLGCSNKGASRDEVLAQLRKEMAAAQGARSIPLYSLIADKAQKAAIAFTPEQLIMVMVGLYR